MLECRDSSCFEHDKDSGNDDYGKEEERPTLEDMLGALKMFHSVDNFFRGLEPHQRRATQLSDVGELPIPTSSDGINVGDMLEVNNASMRQH
jgi:hypothetical protein